jgi:murein DD-endopeptidase MepM/ murein hydrolase activator NlpD
MLEPLNSLSIGTSIPKIEGVEDLARTRLRGAVKDLEALFIYEMLKEMRKATQDGFLGKGLGNDIYGSLFDMEMARHMAERGTGLGQMILKQMEGRGGKEPEIAEEISTPKEHPVVKKKMPTEGRISSAFGWREDPFTGEEKFHKGIDIAAPSGQEILPIQSGRVIFSGTTQGYGNTVVIDHGQGLISKYGHNTANLVSAGEQVKAGQVIAMVGSTGRSTGPHLHLEIQVKGRSIDPLLWLEGKTEVLG